MKKVLFFINTLHTGGAERVLIDLVSKLPKDEYDITVQCLIGGRFEQDLPTGVTYRPLLRVPVPALRRIVSKFFYKLPRLTRALTGDHYDIEIAYLEGFPTKVIAAGTKSHAKKLAVVHTNAAQTDMIGLQYPSREACLSQYRCFDRVLFVSREAMDGFYEVFGPLDNGEVVHNVIDFSRIRGQAQLPCSDGFATEGRKLIAVGRLSPLKGFDRLIRICAKLEKEFDFQLLILGGGEIQADLENTIRETGCRSVRLVGMQENPYNWMQQADLLVCSSFAEGYSTTVVEAMALGLPVLTTACAGMGEILDGGKWGKIVGLSDEELEAGLREVLSDPAVYDDLKQRAVMRQGQLTDDRAAEEYIQLFDSLTD